MRLWIPPVLLASSLAMAQEPQQEYEALLASYSQQDNAAAAARRRFYATEEYTKLVEAGDREAITRLTDALPKVDVAAHGQAFLAAARRYKGTEEALPFLLWLVIDNLDAASAADAARMILEDHADSPELLAVARVAFVVDRLPAEVSAPFKKALLESPDPLVADWVRYREVRPLIGNASADEAGRRKAEELAGEIAAAHPGTLLAKTINGPRFVEERLQIGMEAPDIVGEDLEQVPFKLSDYRGKVVVLDFWGDW